MDCQSASGIKKLVQWTNQSIVKRLYRWKQALPEYVSFACGIVDKALPPFFVQIRF